MSEPSQVSNPVGDSERRRWRRLDGIVIVGLSAIFVVTVVILVKLPNTVPVKVLANRPECPHDWTDVHDTSQYAQPAGVDLDPLQNGQFSISEEYTNIPEFHDCQRVIQETGGVRSYGELAAVFLSANVIRGTLALTGFNPASAGIQPLTISNGHITVAQFDRSVVFKRDPPASQDSVPPNDLAALGIPWVEVVSEGDYPPLSIRAGFNCMYLKFTPKAGELPDI